MIGWNATAPLRRNFLRGEHFMRIGTLWTAGALALFCLASLDVGVQAGGKKKQHPHHHLHHALWELRDARDELNTSTFDFAGLKAGALIAINDAIKQIDLVLMYKGDNITGTPTRGDLRAAYKAYAHHPHTHHALHELRHAHRQLKEAKHNYNGHREAALRDIHVAIQQLELLLKSARKKV